MISRLHARVIVSSVAAVLSIAATNDARADEPASAVPGIRGDAGAALAGEAPADRLLAPSVVGGTRVLEQSDAGVAVVASVRERAVTGVIGSEVDARIVLRRVDGPLSVTFAGMLRRAVGTRDDTDAQGDVTALVGITQRVSVGAEARVRGEVVDGVVASDDVGRPVEVIAGGVVGVSIGSVRLQALGGLLWPRGPAPRGEVGLAGVSYAF